MEIGLGYSLRCAVCHLVFIFCIIYPATSNQPPNFIGFEPAIFPLENTKVGSVLAQLRARDADDTELEFRIQGEIAKDLLELNRTGPMSTNIQLKSPLDRERADTITVIFEVQDSVNAPIQRTLTIYVTDVNDNAPSFINLPYSVNIAEDTEPGTSVFHVSAQDPDSGIWGLVSYSNISPRQSSLFKINNADGTVTLEEPLDYETEKFYQLEIMAKDEGGLNSTTDLIIRVLDVQDTAPFFSNQPYLGEVSESALVGDPIIQILAQDGDRGSSNPIRYSFQSGHHSYFQIDVNTGMISVGRPLNREDPEIRELFGTLDMYVLASEVTNNPQGETTASAYVTIRILDANDETPTFSQSSYTASVQENMPQRIPVTFLPLGTEMIVHDYDQGDNGRFELFLEKDGEPFEVFDVTPDKVINEASILLRVLQPEAIDYELHQSYTFQIVAREYLSTERRENRAQITVNIEDINDNLPQFLQPRYYANFTENPRINTFVTQVQAEDLDSGIFGEITYSISSDLSATSNDLSQLFKVDPQTGVVQVAVAADQDLSLLDRENRDLMRDLQSLIIEARDGGGATSTVKITVDLLDVNDNVPVIDSSQYSGTVRENAAELDKPVIVTASDLDLNENAEIGYTITDGDPSNQFAIDTSTGELRLNRPLDYELMDPASNGRYTLTVTARDAGVPQLSSSVIVVIAVEDVNDQTPVFSEDEYTAVIPENTAGGNTVVVTPASDGDATYPNNDIIYRIDQGAKDKFGMDAGTGRITVTNGANLDRDVYGSEYTLTVIAYDRGTPSLTGTTTVKVEITDINNKKPTFSVSSQSVHISESTSVDTNIFTYPASDLDQTALLEYSLLQSETVGEDENKEPVTDSVYLQSLFGIHSQNGSVYVASELDRETVEEITLTIFVQDINAQIPAKQNNTAKLTVILVDVNDRAPEFQPSNAYYAPLSEASQPGIVVKQVQAIEYDKHADPIKYYLEYNTPESQAFEITDANREEGIITVKEPVDRETYQSITLTVRAEDSGPNPLSNFAEIFVTIEDVNDNSPKWAVFNQTVDVSEDEPEGKIVTGVVATDADSEEFGRVMYFITDDEDGKFTIDSNTGEVKVAGVLDRETKSQYALTIEARDNNNAPEDEQRVTMGYMTVVVTDVNDSPPKFDLSDYFVETLQENSAVNAYVTTVEAFDADDGVNGDITYSIDATRGNASSLFDVDPDSGRVVVKQALRGRTGMLHIVVLASDQGATPLTDSTNVYIHVQDVNDHKPEIYRPEASTPIQVPENVPIGTWVTQVEATDGDDGINGEVQYEFVTSVTNPNKDWLKFSIERSTGNIVTNAEMDRETQGTYFLEVRAFDKGTPSYDDRITLTIEIQDKDDNPPFFDRQRFPPPYTVSIQEDTVNPHMTDLNIASDPDTGNNSRICYYIVGGEQPYIGSFSLNKTSGSLGLVKALDRESLASVQLVLKATDDCGSGKWDDVTTVAWNISDPSLLLVYITVKDINDNGPKFLRKWFTAGVTRDTQPGEEAVLEFKPYVVDPDEPQNQQAVFNIVPPIFVTEPLRTQLRDVQDKDPFILDAATGTLFTNIYFQPDMQGYFSFQVKVNDAVPGHTDVANVSVYLLNEEQRVKVIVRGVVDEVGQFKDHFSDFLSNITGAIINVDKIQIHEDNLGKSDERKADMYIHAINRETGKVLESKYLIDLIDQNYQSLVHLFKEYNVIEIVPAIEVETASSSIIERDLELALILVAAILLVLLIILCATFLMCRRKYKRKLKAATAMAFENHNAAIGSNDSGLNRLEMPGTNMHTYEGSNPIWLEQYQENGWPQESETDSKNSLDENTIEPTVDNVDHRALEPNNHYDEQEMSLEMYNDEFDHFNKVPLSKRADGDLYLKAALQDRDVAKQHRNKNLTNRSVHSNHTNRSNHSNKTNKSNNRHKPPPPPPLPYKGLSNGKLSNGKMKSNGIDKNIYSVGNNLNHSPLPKNSSSKNKSHNGIKHTYDNGAYTGDVSEPYVTRNVDGLQTTDI